jgi:hypothetical protein
LLCLCSEHPPGRTRLKTAEEFLRFAEEKALEERAWDPASK